MKHVLQELESYVDGALSPEDRTRVESHLESCDECRAALVREREFASALARTSVPDPGAAYFDGFAPRVAARLERAKQAEAARRYERWIAWLIPRGRFAWVRAAGALATLTLVTYVGMRGFRPESLRPVSEISEPAAPSESATDAVRLPDSPPSESKLETENLGTESVGLPPKAGPGDRPPGAGPAVPPAASLPVAVPREKPASTRSVEQDFAAAPAAPGPAARRREAESTAQPVPQGGETLESVAVPSRQEESTGPGGSLGKATDETFLRLKAATESSASSERAEERADQPPPPAPPPPPSLVRGGRAGEALQVVPKPESGVADALARKGRPALAVRDLAGADPVESFVEAALAGDTLGARTAFARAATALERKRAAPPSADEVAKMRRWLDAGRLPERRRDIPGFRMQSTSASEADALLALRDLAWARRASPSMRSALEHLAPRLVAGSADAATRAAARETLEWLAATSPSDLERQRWTAARDSLR